MGWLFGRKRAPEDANETLRRYNEAEAARLAAMSSGAPVGDGGDLMSPVTTAPGSAQFEVEDVFTITGRGQVVTGRVTSGALRVDDDIVVLRGGDRTATSRITGIEMFRKRANEATVGETAGLLLQPRVDVARGDVIRPSPSA